ncbi:MAG TPA: BTAD domain-containing putative transcriptional regulator, partial [Thermoanaerobaculia bacterium]|nr:BTAD domain-containing putative transcriptional regulator [Thermoanaerobaculia bacterium]
MLEIRLLGELEVQRDGDPVPLPPSKKTRALLAYLIASGKPQLRDRICELLWEGPDDPRAELRWSLSKLRLPLEDHLAADRERIEFHPEGATIDLHQFSRLLGRGVEHASVHDLYRAAQLVRGEFLEGLELPACYRFQQWLQGERESLRQTHVAVLARLVQQLGPIEDALAYARRRAMIDPFSEEAHIALIGILGALNRNQEAIRQYEHCRLLFERELGRRPSEAVENARRAVGVMAGSSRPGPARAGPYTEQPLIGRREQLESALQANDKIVLITGEPGIGKSRLLGEICGGNAIYGRAFAAEMIRPYGIWIDALADSGGFPTDTSDQARLFDRVVDIVKNSGRAVLALDDLQWLDEASAALLHYASRAIRGPRIFLAARSGELDSNEAACRVIRELSRERRLLQLHLQPLSAEETRELVLRIAVETDVERAVAESAGNPLFAIELARATTASESTTLDQLLADRLADLDPRARELVPWAAALERHFDVEILGRATGMPSGEMMTALETLERCAILRAAPNANRYDFTHDLIRRAAYHKLSGPRKFLVHRQIAQALQATHDPDSALAGEIVHHASLGGDLHLAAHSAAAAGHRCLRLFAYGEAMAVARQGLQIADSLPNEIRISHQMQLLHVIALSRISIKERIGWQPRVEMLLAQARERKMMREA